MSRIQPPPPLRGPPPPEGEESIGVSLPSLGGVRPNAGRGAAAVLALLLATPVLAQPAPDPARGKQVFDTLCSMCHETEGEGPSLVGVVGRKAATTDFPYTAALKASGLTWTPATLDKFLQGPMQMVPGTAMPQSVPDAAQRADLIAYLATMK